MQRPEKIYLEQPIEIKGIRIGLTYEGLKYMVEHYSHILRNASPQQVDEKARQHCEWIIENYRQHIQLYEHPTDNK